MSSTKVLLVHPQREWMTQEVAEAVRSVDGVILEIADDPVAAMAKSSGCEVLMSFFASDQLLTAMPKLRWIQTLGRSEEHTSELQSLMRISYAVFCLNNKNTKNTRNKHTLD